jgi:hypothetical protein
MSNGDSRPLVQPPWIQYPDNEPTWGGWRQGASEAWLLDTWLLFWKQLTPEEQSAYLKLYPPPDDEWLLYLTHFWK